VDRRARRIQRLGTQRARRAPGVDHPVGPIGERPRLRRGEEDPHRVRALLGVVEHHRLVDLALGDGQQLDHHGTALGIPAETHGADPELLLERDLQRVGVHLIVRRVVRQVGAEAAVNLLEQRTDAFGEHRHLLLLQRDADRLGVFHRLQVERAVARLPDGPGDEPVGLTEDMDDPSHCTSDTRVIGRAGQVVPPPSGDFPEVVTRTSGRVNG